MQKLYGITILAALTLVGCGGGPEDDPDMGTVTGTVKMDGKPLANALISFQPVGGAGRPSNAATNEQGQYTLIYSVRLKGARVGEHTVRITTFRGPGPGDDGEFSEGTPETVPNRYNSQTELKKTVEPGSNTIDFDLTSDGEIDKHEAIEDDATPDNF